MSWPTGVWATQLKQALSAQKKISTSTSRSERFHLGGPHLRAMTTEAKTRPWANSWSPSLSALSSWSCCLGLYTLWKGGDTARTWSNKLMRIRVLAQFIAIIIIMAVLYFSQR